MEETSRLKKSLRDMFLFLFTYLYIYKLFCVCLSMISLSGLSGLVVNILMKLNILHSQNGSCGVMGSLRVYVPLGTPSHTKLLGKAELLDANKNL